MLAGGPITISILWRIFLQFFVDDSECDDRSNDQYIMNGQKKQSLNCGLSGRASGGPLFIHLSIYPISVPVDMCN